MLSLAIVCTTQRSNKLKINNFLFIAIGGESKYPIVAMLCTVDTIKLQAIVVIFAGFVAMPMPKNATH